MCCRGDIGMPSFLCLHTFHDLYYSLFFIWPFIPNAFVPQAAIGSRGRSLAVHGLHSDVYLFVLPYFLCSLLINKSLNDQLVKMKDYAYKLLSTFLIHLKYHLNQFYMRITLKKNFLIAYLAIIILI